MLKFRPSLKSIAVIILLIALQSINFAQTYIDVAPGAGTLTDAVKNNAANVIFRLKRGSSAVYLLNGSISNTLPLTIVAEAGTGARPQLIPMVPSGGTSAIPFSTSANLTVKGLNISSKDELGGYNLAQVIRLKADNIRLIVEDCFIENSTQAAVRTDNKNAKIYITNSTIRNMVSDYANGRGIDDRGVDMDTLYVENNTIYNLGSRFLRDGGGVLNYAFINHNTFVNGGLQVMQFGECLNVIFQNNMVVNCGFIGAGKTAVAALTSGLLQLNPLTSAVYAGKTQSVKVRNNNFYLDPAYSKLYGDTVKAVPRFDKQMQAMVDASGLDNTNTAEAITFTAAPPSLTNLVTAYWADPLLSSSTTAIGMRVNVDTYNFAYPTTAASYKKGTGNQPIGALTWFNIAVGVKANQQLPVNFSLSQNYPNPFNPTTIIKYAIKEAGFVRLDVYNVLGQKVNTLVNNDLASGNYEVTWNGKNMTGQEVTSGIYFYKMTINNFTETKKMMLVR